MTLVLPLAAALLTGFAAPAAESGGDLAAVAAKYESGADVVPLREIDRQLLAAGADAAKRAAMEAVLIRMLAPDATFEARRFACERIAVFGTDASLPALAPWLAREESAGIACFALGGLQSVQATEVLRAALATAPRGARLQIVGALGSRGDAGSVKALDAAARDADTGLAGAAIAALGRIPAADARDALAALRRDARPETTDAVTAASIEAADRLAMAGDRATAVALYDEMLHSAKSPNIRRGAFAAMLRLDKDGGMARIREVLSQEPPDVLLTPVAIAHIPGLKASGVSKKFGAMLSTLPAGAQVWMIEALALRADSDALKTLHAQTGAAEPGLRRAAIAATGRTGDATAVPMLVTALAGASAPEDVAVAEQALVALRGGEATHRAVVRAMRKADGAARLALIGILARRGADAAVSDLIEVAGGSDPAAARAAFQALAKLAGPKDLPALLDRMLAAKDAGLRLDAENAAARAMGRIAEGPARSRAVLAMLAADPAVDGRCSLLRLLPVAGDPASLAALQSALGDAEARIREAAVRGLAAWPGAAAWDAVAGVYQRPENDTLRALALRGLVRMAGELNAQPDVRLVERYRQLLAGVRSDDDRKLILSSLAGAASPDALLLALPLLDVPGVRTEAKLAVERMAGAIKASHPAAARDALMKVHGNGGKP
jgi:HEAT repeat protein